MSSARRVWTPAPALALVLASTAMTVVATCDGGRTGARASRPAIIDVTDDTDDKDAKLAAIVDAHRDDADSEDALAAEIADYVGLAVELKKEGPRAARVHERLVVDGR